MLNVAWSYRNKRQSSDLKAENSLMSSSFQLVFFELLTMKLPNFIVFIVGTVCLGGCCLGKILPLIDETFENCASPEEDARALDFSNFEIVAETDTNVYTNGTVKVLIDFGKKLPFRVYAEKLQRDGKWMIDSLDIKRSDFCASLYDPAEFWYWKTKGFRCLKPGVWEIRSASIYSLLKPFTGNLDFQEFSFGTSFFATSIVRRKMASNAHYQVHDWRKEENHVQQNVRGYRWSLGLHNKNVCCHFRSLPPKSTHVVENSTNLIHGCFEGETVMKWRV